MGGITISATIGGFDDVDADLDSFIAGEGLTDRAGHVLRLVVEELVVNAVSHGYGGGPGPVVLTLEADGQRIVGLVADEGPPFDPTTLAAPALDAPLEARAVGGLGVHLVRSMVDELHYARTGGRNAVRFVMAIG